MPDILTDIPGKPGGFWGNHSQCVGPTTPPRWLVRLVGNGFAHDIIGSIAAVGMLLLRHQYHGVVTDGGASGQLFAWMQALIPWGRKPHIMIDCNWYKSGRWIANWLKGLRLRWAARSVERFAVWASHEVDDYANEFGIPREKLEYVPFHTTLSGYTWTERDEGYIFAGGNFDRDYPTLVEAVRGLDVPTWIATTRSDQLAGVNLPANVRVEGTTAAGFRDAAAGASLTVVPMKAGLLHSGGQQTCLNGMAMGKPTIAVGKRWASDLIDDGDDGLIVDYGDVSGLRLAIRRILDNPEAARRMGERARWKAARFTTERTMRRIHELATRETSHARAEAARA